MAEIPNQLQKRAISLYAALFFYLPPFPVSWNSDMTRLRWMKGKPLVINLVWQFLQTLNILIMLSICGIVVGKCLLTGKTGKCTQFEQFVAAFYIPLGMTGAVSLFVGSLFAKHLNGINVLNQLIEYNSSLNST